MVVSSSVVGRATVANIVVAEGVGAPLHLVLAPPRLVASSPTLAAHPPAIQFFQPALSRSAVRRHQAAAGRARVIIVYRSKRVVGGPAAGGPRPGFRILDGIVAEFVVDDVVYRLLASVNVVVMEIVICAHLGSGRTAMERSMSNWAWLLLAELLALRGSL